MHIVKACIDYFKHQGVLPDGGKILDPFGGTGTTALATQYGYDVVLIELEEVFLKLLKDLRLKWHNEHDGDSSAARRVTILAGNCCQVLPQLQANSFDMVLTSPPYAN